MDTETSPTPPSRILNSWKEIATYLGRGVRTVQRYEVQYGFPVHRPAGKNRTSVLAFADELDLWLRQTPNRNQIADIRAGSQQRESEEPLMEAKREMEEAFARYQSALERYRKIEACRFYQPSDGHTELSLTA